MRKYVHPSSTVFELCWKPSERSKTRRTGRLENDLTNISITTREEIARLRSNNLIVFFVSYADDEERERYQSAHRQVSFSLPTPEHNQHVQIRKPRKVKRQKGKVEIDTPVCRLIAPDFVIENINYRLLKAVYDRLWERKIPCTIVGGPSIGSEKEKMKTPVSIGRPAQSASPPASAVSRFTHYEEERPAKSTVNVSRKTVKRLLLADIIPPYFFKMKSYKDEDWSSWEDVVEKWLIGQDYRIIHWHDEEDSRRVTVEKGHIRRSYGYSRLIDKE